jgi:hypothetical protein
MIGEQAIELIDIGLVAMQMNATFQAFIDACFNFPSLAELYKYATYDAMKRKQQGRVQGRSMVSETADAGELKRETPARSSIIARPPDIAPPVLTSRAAA